MEARIYSGEDLAQRIREDCLKRVRGLKATGAGVRLDAVIVGEPEAGVLYARSQQRRCEEAGIEYVLHTLDASSTNEQVQEAITELSRTEDVTGILLNLPLPVHLDTPAAQYAIDPYKDIEGVNPANIGLLFYGTPIIAPCTALAVMAILRDLGVELRGRRAVVVGQGSIVGKPIALALINAEATVTTCNEHTEDFAALTRTADLLVSAAGVPNLIRPDQVKPGAVVIDVGINPVPGGAETGDTPRVVGDVAFDDVRNVASVLTPVPGGVGPVTVAYLLYNAVEAAAKQRSARRIH